MPMKFHNSPDGPKRCTANIRDCMYSQAGDPHFDNFDDAQKYFEEKQVEKYGSVAKLSKASAVSNLVKGEYYRAIYRSKEAGIKANNRLQSKIKTAVANPTVQNVKKELFQVLSDMDNAVIQAERKVYDTARQSATVIHEEINYAKGEFKQQQKNFLQRRNRIIGRTRFAKMRTKMFVSQNADKLKSVPQHLKNTVQTMRDHALQMKNQKVDRVKSAVNEGKRRVRLASDLQKSSFQALKNSQNTQKSTIELTPLGSSQINEKALQDYFKAISETKRSHRADMEAKEPAAPGQGRHRANVSADSVTV